MNMKSKKYYAYVIPSTGTKGIAGNWDECKGIVSGAPIVYLEDVKHKVEEAFEEKVIR